MVLGALRKIQVGAAIAAVALSIPTVAQAGWEAPAQIAGTGASVDVKPVGGVPHIGWVGAVGRELHVARLSSDGLTWLQLGAGTLSGSGSLRQSITIADIGGVPHAAWNENDVGGRLEARAARYDAGTNTWMTLPKTLGDDPAQAEFGVTLTGHQGRVHVSFIERRTDSGFNDFQVKVKRLSLDGLSWENLGGPINRSSQDPSLPVGGPVRYDAADPALLSAGSKLYVAFSEFDGLRDQIHVSRFDPATNTWPEVGSGPAPVNHPGGGSGENPSLTAISGVPFVAWQQSGQIRVSRMRGDGSGFEQLVGGDSPVLGDPAARGELPSLSAVGDVPWVAWQQCPGTSCSSSQPSEVRVARLNRQGTAFREPTGAPVEPEGAASNSHSLTDIGGVPYVGTDSGGIRAYRLQPDFLSAAAIPTDDGVTLLASLRGFGLPYPAGFEIGSQTTATQPLTEGSDEDTITAIVNGLTPSTQYSFRPFAFAGFAPTAFGPTGTFTTDAPAGEQGPAGPSGPRGPTGPSGTSGPSGPTGPSGPAGFEGPSGPTGPGGPSGPTGLTGPDGQTGPSGPSGPSGFNGPTGPTGANGPSGQAGPSGPSGQPGPSGASGAVGPGGPAGADGASGVAGPPGPTGPTGDSAQPLLAIVNHQTNIRSTSRRYRVRYLSTTAGAATLTLLRGRRLLARQPGSARIGSNRLALRLPRLRPGVYRVEVQVTDGAGRTASDDAGLRVSLRPPRR